MRRSSSRVFAAGSTLPDTCLGWPGGTQLNGGRLGVMIPVAVGQALGKRAKRGEGGWVICHCGDAGYISGQALNGFNGAAVHGAPITFVMHRNGIQLSGATEGIMDKDPRPIVAAMGVEVIEIETLHDAAVLYETYVEGYKLAQQGRPTLIYPTGTHEQLGDFGERMGIGSEVVAFAAEHGVELSTRIWIPGSLMSYRDVVPMLECLFLVNKLPGGEGHHDGHMKGRDAAQVLSNPMFQKTAAADQALATLRQDEKRQVETRARPAPGSRNLVLPESIKKEVSLPAVGMSESPRAGSEAAYAAVAAHFPDDVFVVSCDLDPSTKLAKARGFLADDHQFEMSIEEQAACLITDGLAMSGPGPQFNVVSTFAAFYEGIAREGFDVWRYQRNLTGVKRGPQRRLPRLARGGLHWARSLFGLGLGVDQRRLELFALFAPLLRASRCAGGAFLAVCDMAAHYGGHIIGIPRDSLPILAKQDGSGPLWEAGDAWEPLTAYRTYDGAEAGDPSFWRTGFSRWRGGGTTRRHGGCAYNQRPTAVRRYSRKPRKPLFQGRGNH